jgi:hypothetical protein
MFLILIFFKFHVRSKKPGTNYNAVIFKAFVGGSVSWPMEYSFIVPCGLEALTCWLHVMQGRFHSGCACNDAWHIA